MAAQPGELESNVQLTDEDLEGLRGVVRHFVTTELLPLERSVQEREAERGLSDAHVITPEQHAHLMDSARDLDLWGLDVPVEYGGQGLGMRAKMIAVEELHRSIVPFRLPPESPNLRLLIEACSEEQRERYLLPYAAGELRASLALTEPGAGSDAAAISTSAKRDGDSWVINGTKHFISWADQADFFIVIAVTDREKRARGGISAFLVDRDTPGLEIGKHMATMGEPTPYELIFTDCRIGSEQMLGEVGFAFTPIVKRLDVRRIEMAARCVGMAERLIELMVEQAQNRWTFGAPLADRQMVQEWIADSVIETHATRLMVTDAARKYDSGDRDLRLEASATKVFGTEMISRVVDRALQLYGGMGFSKELPIEYIYRNSRFLRVLEGASEIHRVQIARLYTGRKR
jgi:alkylation response protein AidB-like acyl-CoA dehydrogenase